MASGVSLTDAALTSLPQRPIFKLSASRPPPLFSRCFSGQFAIRKHATLSSISNVFHPSFPRSPGTPTVCRAESDDISLKRQRDRERIEQVLPDFAELEKGGLSSLLELELESSYRLETARHYEVVFLVHENCVDELEDVVQKVKGFISEKKGKIWRFNDWGMRRLAYKIKTAKKANYILMNIQIGSQVINDFKSLLENDERVIRYLVMKRKYAMTEDTVAPPDYKTFADEEDSDEYDDEEGFDEEEDEDFEETEEEEDSTLKV